MSIHNYCKKCLFRSEYIDDTTYCFHSMLVNIEDTLEDCYRAKVVARVLAKCKLLDYRILTQLRSL